MAHRKPLGTTCALYYDSPREVKPFDVIRTNADDPSHYRVLSVRVQERGEHVGRKHLMCLRISGVEVEDDDTVHPLYWYRRGRSRR